MVSKSRCSAAEQRFDNYSDFFRNSTFSAFEQKHRRGGSFGLQVIQIAQPPLALTGPPLPEVLFAIPRSSVRHATIDYGDGRSHRGHMPSLAFNVIPPMTEARFEMSDGFTVITAVLPTARLEPLFEEIGFGDDAFAHHYACGTATPQPHLARMIDRLWHASRSTDSVSALLLDGLTLQFLAHVARVKELSPTAAARPEDVRIARAIDFAEAHIDEALTVAELAAVACLSPAHFSRVFKATTGEAVWSFVQRRRGERAMEMLQHTDRSIAEIAFRCGFASQAHFTRCFKRQFGVTPGAVRT